MEETVYKKSIHVYYRIEHEGFCKCIIKIHWTISVNNAYGTSPKRPNSVYVLFERLLLAYGIQNEMFVWSETYSALPSKAWFTPTVKVKVEKILSYNSCYTYTDSIKQSRINNLF